MRRFAAQNALLRSLALAGLVPRRAPGEPQAIETWKIRIVDGDTFWHGAERIRVRGYDAPELPQPGGFEASQRLESLLREGEVWMYPHGLDVYGRTVADIYVDQRNVAEVMIAEGHTKKR
jgi:endonuclease YncB( thermonuclease family)